MHLLVATILPIVDHPKWFQIKIEKKNDGSQTWASLGRGTLHFQPESGVWQYYPQYAILVFKLVKGSPALPYNFVMAFERVRWDFLDVFSSVTCKGTGVFGEASRGYKLPTKGFIWVAGPGLPKAPPKSQARGVKSYPASGGIERAPHQTHVYCNDPICPDAP